MGKVSQNLFRTLSITNHNLDKMSIRAGQEYDKGTPHEDKLVGMFLFLLSSISRAQMEKSRRVLSDLSQCGSHHLQDHCNTQLLSIEGWG